MSLAGVVGVLEEELAQTVTAAKLLSLIAAPFIIHYSDRLVMRWPSTEWMMRSIELHRIAVQGIATERHVVVCGYCRTGQRLAHLLEQAGISLLRWIPIQGVSAKRLQPVNPWCSVTLGESSH